MTRPVIEKSSASIDILLGIMDITKILTTSIFGNALHTWLIALGVFLLSFLGLLVLKNILVSRLKKLADRTFTSLDDFAVDLLERTKSYFLIALAVYFGVLFTGLNGEIRIWLQRVVIAVLIVQVGFWISGLINYLVKRRVERQIEADAASATTLNALGLIGQIVVWSIVLLLILENVTNIEMDALIASLGITGIAVGLAVQNILGDLFASLSIVLDKPFVIGDFVIVGDFVGTVEHIGLKSTRLRSLSGEQLVFSNSDLLSSRIRNYKRMARRRILFGLGVTYQTPTEKLEAIPEIVREIIEEQPLATFDRAHFKDFGDFSLNFEVVYYMETPDYEDYMDTQQAINLALFRRFSQEDIEFAYPTHTVLVEGETQNDPRIRMQPEA